MNNREENGGAWGHVPRISFISFFFIFLESWPASIYVYVTDEEHGGNVTYEIYERHFTNIITTLRYQTNEQTFTPPQQRITNLFYTDKIMRIDLHPNPLPP